MHIGSMSFNIQWSHEPGSKHLYLYALRSIMSLIFQKNVNYEMIRQTLSYAVAVVVAVVDSYYLFLIKAAHFMERLHEIELVFEDHSTVLCCVSSVSGHWLLHENSSTNALLFQKMNSTKKKTNSKETEK